MTVPVKFQFQLNEMEIFNRNQQFPYYNSSIFLLKEAKLPFFWLGFYGVFLIIGMFLKLKHFNCLNI